jgi:hypothetical protein
MGRLTMDTVPVRLPGDAQPGAVVELYRTADGTMAAQVRIPAPGRTIMAEPHQYLSTACLHGEHGYCQSMTGSNGSTEWAKTPASCKVCGAPCTCPCHAAAEPRSDEDRIRDAMAEAQDHPGRLITR